MLNLESLLHLTRSTSAYSSCCKCCVMRLCISFLFSGFFGLLGQIIVMSRQNFFFGLGHGPHYYLLDPCVCVCVCVCVYERERERERERESSEQVCAALLLGCYFTATLLLPYCCSHTYHRGRRQASVHPTFYHTFYSTPTRTHTHTYQRGGRRASVRTTFSSTQRRSQHLAR